MEPPLIIRRLDAALANMAVRKMEVRAIYLTDADRKLFNRHMTRCWREGTGSKARVRAFSYRDIEIRPGKQSKVYSVHGVALAVPRRVG